MTLNSGVQIGLVLSVVLLCISLSPVTRIIKMLHPGPNRTIWIGLGGLIGLFVLGDIVYLRINSLEGDVHHEDWLVGLCFFVIANFVFAVCRLSYATALEVSRLASLEMVANIDPVTELCNRRRIMSLLDDECARSARNLSPLSVLLVDVDNFKRVNDTYGHQAGDVVLKEIAQLIVRKSPLPRLVGRYGGEEFLVLLPGVGSSDAGAIAETIRAVVQATAIVSSGDPIMSPTISIGVATAFGLLEKSEVLVAVADEALYAAKTAGKNRVCHAFEPSGKKLLSEFAVITPTY
jgi:diguanylate cyclase (GGDEF)-like protein